MFILRNVYPRDFVQASFLIYNVLFDSLALNVRLAPLKLQMTDRILQTLESEKNRTSAQKTGKEFQVHIPKVQQTFTASSPKQKNWLCSQGRRDWICTFPCQSKWQQEIVRDCDLMYVPNNLSYFSLAHLKNHSLLLEMALHAQPARSPVVYFGWDHTQTLKLAVDVLSRIVLNQQSRLCTVVWPP